MRRWPSTMLVNSKTPFCADFRCSNSGALRTLVAKLPSTAGTRAITLALGTCTRVIDNPSWNIALCSRREITRTSTGAHTAPANSPVPVCSRRLSTTTSRLVTLPTTGSATTRPVSRPLWWARK